MHVRINALYECMYYVCRCVYVCTYVCVHVRTYSMSCLSLPASCLLSALRHITITGMDVSVKGSWLKRASLRQTVNPEVSLFLPGRP